MKVNGGYMEKGKIFETLGFIGLFFIIWLTESFLFIVACGGTNKMEIGIRQTIIDIGLIYNPAYLILIMLGLPIIFFGFAFILAEYLSKMFFNDFFKGKDKG